MTDVNPVVAQEIFAAAIEQIIVARRKALERDDQGALIEIDRLLRAHASSRGTNRAARAGGCGAMPDEIEPALTPEEWAAARNTVYLRDVLRDCADSAMSFEGDEFLVKAMAVANAALPDADPHRITREDVALLREDGLWFAREARGSYDREPGARNVALAAKLAALLPPEP